MRHRIANWLRRGLQAEAVARTPAYVRYRERLRDGSQSPATPVGEARLLVLDTETTGLDLDADRIVSFAAVPAQGSGFEVRDAVDWPIRSTLPSDPVSIEVHGILNTELERGYPEREFTTRLLGLADARVIVGYRPGFDMAIINRLVREHHGGKLRNPVLDVATLAMRLDYPLKPPFVNPEPYRFERLCARFEIAQPGRHTAIGDAYATTLLALRLIGLLREQGVKTLGALLRRYP